jgi:glycosyltransferase involved in cell wall biosynthesis
MSESNDVERPPHCLAMVTPAWPAGTAPNGIVTYTSHLAPAFRQRGVRTVLLAWDVANRPLPNMTAEDDGDVIDIAKFKPGRSLLGKAAAKARRLLPASDFGDAKFAMMVRAVRSALAHFPIEILEIEEAFGLASRIVKLKRIPVVTRLQGPWFLNGEVLGVKKDAEFYQRVEQERLSIAWADAITSPSQDILDRTRDFYGLPLEGAQVIPCPIDPRPDTPPWKLAEADQNRIVFVGRFDLHKGGDVMIDAFARLAASRPELRLDFVGPDRGIPNGSGGRLGIVDYIRCRISDASVASRIVIHGQKRADEIDDFRRRGFVTVVPSRYETFGYTAAEALRLGCPLVAADSGGLREIVRKGETGLLFPAGNAALLAGQIDRLLVNSELAARLGEAGRRDVGARYHPTAIAESTLDLYASVVERWRPSRARGGLSRPTA